MKDQPNILLLLSDQERYDVTNSGDPDVDTPNLDSLRHEGMYFTHAFTPISICTSARGSLLSGLYPHNHGMINNCHGSDALQENFPTEIPTFGHILSNKGYKNTYVGKWHVGQTQTPSDFGFQYLGGGDGQHEAEDQSFRQYQQEIGVDHDEIQLEETIYTDQGTDPTLIAGKTPIPMEATRTYYLAEKTITRLENCDNEDGPLFHRTDFVGPHHPYVVPEPYASMYDPSEISQWPNFKETFADKPEVHEKYVNYRGVDHLTWQKWSEAIAKYFGFVTFIDDQIGRILEAVETHLDPNNTAVFHTADHGDFTGSHRQFNKGPVMYDETYHIPLIVRWPQMVEQNVECNKFVRLLDLMPTFLEIGGASPPEDIDGQSIVPLLKQEPRNEWMSEIFAEYHGDEFGLYSQRMIRTKEFKYIYNTPGIDELYDLEEDPHELQNLITHPGYQETIIRLRNRLVDWQKKTDDPIAPWSEKALKQKER